MFPVGVSDCVGVYDNVSLTRTRSVEAIRDSDSVTHRLSQTQSQTQTSVSVSQTQSTLSRLSHHQTRRALLLYESHIQQ